jgi:hypothetical protein
MRRKLYFCAPMLLVAGAIAAADETSTTASVAKAAEMPAQTDAARADGAKGKDSTAATGDKTLSGMSILGNQEAPMALVIVPWKSSRLGDTLDISKNLDDSRQPVDRDVFKRELAYYEIRTGESGAGSK